MRQLFEDVLRRLINALDAPAQWVKPWEETLENSIGDASCIDEVLGRYYASEGIIFVEAEQNGSFYTPELDTIVLPPKRHFISLGAYCAVKAHETVHSTGEYTRCNREVFGDYIAFAFGDSRYSREELVAEIGACFLLNALNIDASFAERNASAYLSNWLAKLNNNTKWIYKAGALAEEAVEYILETAGEEAGE